MDSAIHERLINARARLRSAVEHSLVPDWLLHTAQRCLIDLDCALSDGFSVAEVRMLLAQVDALVNAVGDPSPSGGGRGVDTR